MTSSLSHLVTEKLTRENFILWKAQVLPDVCGAQLMGYLDGSTKAPLENLVEKKTDGSTVETSNPAYALWLAHDQQVLSYILTSLSKEVLS